VTNPCLLYETGLRRAMAISVPHRTTFSAGDDRMSFSQNRDVTHRPPAYSRVWSPYVSGR
jgi:hypothetical protein